MESLPKEILFMIFQNLHPLELVPLSRVNNRWRDVALHPRLHKCLHLQHGQRISSLAVCKYISKFKHSLEDLNLQDCYWLKTGPLSSALQTCRKLRSLNVMGCEVSKKTICSVFKNNKNVSTLEWSLNYDDMYTSTTSLSRNQELKLLTSFCGELNQAFKGLDRLTIAICLTRKNAQLMNNSAVPIICRGLCLRKFTLQWTEIRGGPCSCFELAIEGSRSLFENQSCSGEHLPERSVVFSSKLKEIFLVALASQRDCGKLHSFLFPYWATMEPPSLYINHLQILEDVSLTNIDLGDLRVCDSTLLSAILSKQTLHYLNLCGLKIDGHLLQVVATSSPNLKVLNLHNCVGCFELLQGLKSLAICCPNLSQLNLHGVHLQASNGKWQNTLIEVIAEFKHLVSLSVCACVLCQAGESKRVGSSVDFSGKLMKTGKRVSHCSSVGSATQNELSCEGCFERMTKSCREITEFELIRLSVPGLTFTKTHYDPVQCNTSSIERCHSIRGVFDTLVAVQNWTSLQRLTLAVPFMKGNLKFLTVITQNCSKLQFLSLAVMASLGHSGNVVLLQQALSYCHQLRDLRLEQPSFGITESFMLTLGQLKHLERVCIIAKGGTMKMYPQAVLSVFEKCCKLYFFQVLCDITLKASRALVDAVTQRFAKARPGLVMSVVPFRDSRTQLLSFDIAKSIPVVHFKEMFLFGSTVATKLPV
ncbi:F-box/LRR-repeat protein 18-like isoform X1 [Montipora capricornis]|uniref:F-box/LRR-repeat protein 18-like isoform X1 n=1 Tax=Montipora capricornis TaxID=246305 RepID=UPI0035F129EE